MATNAFGEFAEWFKYYLPSSAILIAFIIFVSIVIYNYFFGTSAQCKNSFTNKSPFGYRYDVDTMTFPTTEDKNIAYTALVKLLNEEGINITMNDLTSKPVPSHFIISILEAEEGDDTLFMKANLLVYLDPNNQKVKQLINRASVNTNINKFNDSEREMIYNLLSVYFTAMKQPMRYPLKMWSDSQLIKAYHTRKLPLDTQFSS